MSKLLPTDIVKSQPAILQVHLSLCIDFILSHVNDVVSIILTGGYGRGEGTWIEENDSYVPYNDYDFIVITSEKAEIRGAKPLSLKTVELAALLGINWVDIDFLSVNQLKTLKPTVKNFDILHGSVIIYGDDRILDRARPICARQLSTQDFYTYFNTRAYTVLCCLPAGRKLSELEDSDLRFFRNQVAKGLLCVMDCTLISEYGFYCSSYIKRFEYYKKASKNEENIAIFSWALNEKIDPSNNSFDLNFGYQIHEKLYELYQTDMNRFLGQYFYGINVSIKRYPILRFTRAPLVAKYFLSTMSKQFERYKVEQVLNYLQYILIMTWTTGGDSGNFEKHKNTIKKLIQIIQPGSQTNLCRSSCIDIVRSSR